MSEVPLSLYTLDLISQYLSRVTALSPNSPAADYTEANRLVIQLAMLLPANMFRLVREGAESNDLTGLWSSILDIRSVVQAQGALDITDAIFHAPPAVPTKSLN